MLLHLVESWVHPAGWRVQAGSFPVQGHNASQRAQDLGELEQIPPFLLPLHTSMHQKHLLSTCLLPTWAVTLAQVHYVTLQF